ncbi:MAG: hypothetical protein ABW131_00235 [Candidatus Sedimenticola sp. 6PFRAG5]
MINRRQKGAVLLVLLTILVLGAVTLFFSQLKYVDTTYIQYQRSDEVLQEARGALIGWALTHENQPGLFPVPDLPGDGDYDGQSDCPAGAINSSHLLGQLPWKAYAAPCVDSRGGTGAHLKDASGASLWYAVTRNLLYEFGYPVINSQLADSSSGWITVRDNSGAVLSDRVAAVVIAPGVALQGQERIGAASPASQFLDSVTIGATIYSNANFDSDFIRADESDNFNDRLEFITIDELMVMIERKVAVKVRGCLDDYAAVSGDKYPWAAPLDGASAPGYAGVYNSGFGRLPDSLNIESSPGVVDPAMQLTWQPADCFSGMAYWNNWREMVFYQVAPGYQPGSGASCPDCLTLNGSGAFRAMVVVAGQRLAGQNRSSNSDQGEITNYLEGDNADADTAFEMNVASALFNDRAICVDGGNLCL